MVVKMHIYFYVTPILVCEKVVYYLAKGRNTLDPLLAKLSLDYVDDADLSLRLGCLFKARIHAYPCLLSPNIEHYVISSEAQMLKVMYSLK